VTPRDARFCPTASPSRGVYTINYLIRIQKVALPNSSLYIHMRIHIYIYLHGNILIQIVLKLKIIFNYTLS
jgi:hypothetical protein